MEKKLRIIKLPYQKEGICEGPEERRGISPGLFPNSGLYCVFAALLIQQVFTEIHVPIYMDPGGKGILYCYLGFLCIWYCFCSKISLCILGK